MLHCTLGYIDPISQNAQIEPQDFRLRFYVAIIELKMRCARHSVDPNSRGAASSTTQNWGGIGGVLTGGAKVDFILAGFCGYLVGIFTSGRGRLGSQACQLDEELEVISIVPYSWPSSCMLEVEVGICPDISLPSPTLNLVIILGEVLSLMDPAFITIRARSV